MSSVINTNTNQEQSGCEGTVEVVPPYHNDVESFDNPDEFPDLEFVVGGMERPLQLHRRILAHASGKVKAMLNERRGQRLEWPYDTTKEVDKEALVKALRFCYGETQIVGTKNGECIAFVVAFTRLQVTCLNDVVTLLSNFAMDEAKRNLEIGVELLKLCAGYKEMSGTNQLTLDKKLAAIVLTKDNMQEHYKEVVDECLMVLPPEYLMIAEFGEPHTRCSEFCLRTKYVRFHANKLTKEQKQAMISKCDWSTLNSHELRELRMADIIDKDELLEAHEKALEQREIENEQATEMARKIERKMEEKVNEIEKEKDEEMNRAEKAEREREELRKRAEATEKEKEEKVKQAEMERDEKVKAAESERDKFRTEAEECKKRTEITEKEKMEESKRATKAETEKEEFRQRAEKAEKEKDKMKEAEIEKGKRLKAAEVEKDKCAREAQGYKRRAEIAEKENEEKAKQVKAWMGQAEKVEKERDEYKRRAEIAENGRKEESKRAMKAETEREELRKRAEIAEKEKEERVKQVKEWMVWAKSVEKERDEFKKRAEKAEQEKEDLCKRIETLENFMKINRLL